MQAEPLDARRILGEPSGRVGQQQAGPTGAKSRRSPKLTGLNTLGTAPCYDKLGVYRSRESTTTAVVYHDDYRVTQEFFSSPPS